VSKPELIKRSGWLFIAAAFAFITILSNSDPISIPGSLVSAILLTPAMSNLRIGYGERIGYLGRNSLLLGMSAPALWVIGIVFMALMGEEAVGKGWWVLLFAGPAISLLGLTLFGLTALFSKPMARLNWLPVLAGIWYPVTYTLFSVYDIAHKGMFPDPFVPELVLITAIQFLALSSLGIVLISDSSKKLATT
jgi:hypothetical protein